MLKLAYKIFILGIVLILLSILGNSLIGLPYYWGNDQLAEKNLYLAAQTMQPQAYFIGSSIIYHGIDPTTFSDFTNKPTNYAFNLGIDGAQPPKTFYILEALLEKKDPIDYIFFEMGSFDQMAEHHFQTTRSKYYYSLNHLWLSIKYFYHSNYLEKTELRITHKLGLIARNGVTFLESMFKIGMRKEMIRALTNRIPNTQATVNKHYGYYPLFAQEKKDKADIDKLNHQLKITKSNFVAAYAEQPTQAEYNPVLQEKFMELIHKAKAKNIRLVYLLTPFECAFDSAPEMLTLFQSLPAANRIDLADPNKYPAFYDIANRWDIGHFNDTGAKLYTQKLSELTKYFALINSVNFRKWIFSIDFL